MDQTTNQLLAWLTTHLLGLLIGIVLLALALRYARPIIHRFVVTLLKAQQAAVNSGGAPAAEIQKRAATLEELFIKLVRAIIATLVVVLILSVFDLWPMVAGLGIIAAAFAIAGQQIILDYLMGVLILIEGQYYKGDWLVVPEAGGGPIQGEVEEVGLRRTVLRGTDGTVHSISNGAIRIASNMTRVYGVSTVHLFVLRAQDLSRALEIIDEVYEGMSSDPEWTHVLLDAPRVVRVNSLSLDGAEINVRFRVAPDERWSAASEVRRRLALAFAENGIAIGRWDVAGGLPIHAGMAAADAPAAGS